jgi:hypothetical protein
MNYFISRDGQQYGPYTLADLQRYVASGEVLLTDLATSEGHSEPVSVAQIVGNIAAPAAYSGGFGGTAAPVVFYPAAPNLHWGLVLLFGVLTCGVFSIVWDIVQAAWLKKVDPASKALYFYIGAAALLGGIFFSSFFAGLTHSRSPFTGLFQLGYYVVLIVSRFSFKNSMERHYNTAEPMGLLLSGVMTFFFGGIYFQYHINDIARRKELDMLYATGR